MVPCCRQPALAAPSPLAAHGMQPVRDSQSSPAVAPPAQSGLLAGCRSTVPFHRQPARDAPAAAALSTLPGRQLAQDPQSQLEAEPSAQSGALAWQAPLVRGTSAQLVVPPGALAALARARRPLGPPPSGSAA